MDPRRDAAVVGPNQEVFVTIPRCRRVCEMEFRRWALEVLADPNLANATLIELQQAIKFRLDILRATERFDDADKDE